VRKHKSSKMMMLAVDSRFNTIAWCVNEPVKRAPKGVPHCDCYTSNVRFTGNKRLKFKTESVYKLVPTDTQDGSTCTHCGHVAPLIVPTTSGRTKGHGKRYWA
jgi:hypothetical protein